MNNWFSSPSGSQTSLKPDGQPKERPTDTSKPKSTRGDTTRNRTDQQTQPGLPFVPVLSTPHDTILSELSGRSLNVQPLPTGDIVRSEDALSVPLPKPSIGSLEHADGTTSPTGTLGKSMAGVDLASVQIGPSNATSPVPGPSAETNPIYDPFTGQSMGFLPAHSSSHPRSPFQTTHTSRDASRERSETLQSQGQFEQAKEDLWNHVGKIRKLQSEIAGMHIELEGIGQSGDTFGVSLSGSATGSVGGIPKRPSGPGGRLHEDTIGGSEQWYDPEESEKERKRAMDAEFNTLAETFEGRAGKINGIMDKLEELSKALTTFHSLPTPKIDLVNSRSGTKDSVASPVLRSPSPMFANPSAHGALSPPSPPIMASRPSAKSMSILKTDIGKLDSPLVESPTSHHHPLVSLDSIPPNT